jgi:hypothetical protein
MASEGWNAVPMLSVSGTQRRFVTAAFKGPNISAPSCLGMLVFLVRVVKLFMRRICNIQ